MFEPVQIGPVTARNRFYQTPHAIGCGDIRPNIQAAMRGVKAEGGWAVVHTEFCSIAPTSDLGGEIVHKLWSDEDVPGLAAMAAAVHEHGALAGIQLSHASYFGGNKFSRLPPIGPTAKPINDHDPIQVRQMDAADIRGLLNRQRSAARRAKQAGFDILMVDANYSTAFHFLSPRNRRTDEYGGSMRNRARLLRELIEVTREEAADKCAVTVRLTCDEMMGEAGFLAERDGVELFDLIGELPDLWDLVVGKWADDSLTSRFFPEGAHESKVSIFKSLTQRPIVGTGRFTSPDTMVSQIRRGILDLIGAARPSIADPFLPNKIRDGLIEDIRECIGCNICVSGHFAGVPIPCTQNPASGEEWKRGWHPEIIGQRKSDDRILIIGAGPAGLEAALWLGRRGYEVALAEASKTLGGRVARESLLPGLSAWARVRDWREGQIAKMTNVSVFRESRLTVQDVLSLGFARVVVATGSRWLKNGPGHGSDGNRPIAPGQAVLTPDDLMAGVACDGPVLIYDEDHYYLGGVLAGKLRQAGNDVLLVTPASTASSWMANTLEQARVQRQLTTQGVRIFTDCELIRVGVGQAEICNVYSDFKQTLQFRNLLMINSRAPSDELYHELIANRPALDTAGILSVDRIGDCHNPGTIAAAVFSGHRFAREFDEPAEAQKIRREQIIIARELPAMVCA